MDKRKHYYAVIDTETAGSLFFPLVYDLGVSICDKKGNIVAQKQWIIRNIFDQKAKFESAYYGWKRPQYLEMLEKGIVEKVSFKQALYALNKLMQEWNVKTVCAYNMGFDLRALKSTAKYTKLQWASGSTDIFWKEYQQQCIWGLACETLYQQKGFEIQAIENNRFTAKGNPLTNAEVGYQYLTKNMEFEEDHTALADTEIECKIMAKCFAQKKKYTKGIKSHPWRIVANRFKRIAA